MDRLNPAEVEAALALANGWCREGEAAIKQTFRFRDFREAMRFVNGAAEIAEELGHHPDMDIRYNRVIVSLTTHDAGGLTELDFNLGAKLSELGTAVGSDRNTCGNLQI